MLVMNAADRARGLKQGIDTFSKGSDEDHREAIWYFTMRGLALPSTDLGLVIVPRPLAAFAILFLPKGRACLRASGEHGDFGEDSFSIRFLFGRKRGLWDFLRTGLGVVGAMRVSGWVMRRVRERPCIRNRDIGDREIIDFVFNNLIRTLTAVSTCGVNERIENALFEMLQSM